MNPNIQDLIRYAESFLGIPYIFGGKSYQGMDCSMLACEVLKSIGFIGYHEQLSAQGLCDRLSSPGKGSVCDRSLPGSFLFFGKSPALISHVAIAISPYSLLESGGGDERCISTQMANSIDARVRRRGINYRLDFITAIYPLYPWDI